MICLPHIDNRSEVARSLFGPKIVLCALISVVGMLISTFAQSSFGLNIHWFGTDYDSVSNWWLPARVGEGMEEK